eukprot:TRINITY_DN29097_c0_g1_i1.p1 TRINITY_DN29097_c0_g1~~TRINITY_DN29097_c0_g1_i1.p1  ORF type:complete len:447 (-),score=69.50 TRINITY_DN29097_c0_g1_i1:104-1444(-)
MDDWDPFADPAEAVQTRQEQHQKIERPEQAVGDAGGNSGGGGGCNTDIFAALKKIASTTADEPSTTPEEGLEELLDSLFQLSNDATKSVCEAAFEPVAKAASKNMSFNFRLWQRALPLLEVSPRPMLLDLLIEHQTGFSIDSTSNPMHDVHVEDPLGSPDGVVIFLFGWGGGTLEELLDVAAQYRSLRPGATVVISTSNHKESFGLRCQCAVAMFAAAKAWSSMNPSCIPQLIVHLFSNAGMHTWTEMLQSWEAVSSSERVEESLGMQLPPMSDVLKGVLLDSACDGNVPIDPAIQSMVQAMAGFIYQVASSSLGQDGSEETRREADIKGKKFMHILIGHQSPAKDYLRSKPERQVTRSCCADTPVVHRLEPPVPLQFIYSKDDSVISFDAVERYISEVKSRANRKGLSHPRQLVLQKSKHCFHKVNHQEEYFNCMKLFASSILTN